MNDIPSEIRLSDGGRMLKVSFPDGKTIDLLAEYLRIESPSAEVQGHSPQSKIIVAGKRSVTISDVRSIGNYAIRLIFDDGHATGLYSWNYLIELAADKDLRWADYLRKLDDLGLSRD